MTWLNKFRSQEQKRRGVFSAIRSPKRRQSVLGVLRTNEKQSTDIVTVEKSIKSSTSVDPLLKLDSATMESIQAVFDTLNFSLGVSLKSFTSNIITNNVVKTNFMLSQYSSEYYSFNDENSSFGLESLSLNDSDMKKKNYATFQRILRESGNSTSNIAGKYRNLDSWEDALSFLSTLFQFENIDITNNTDVSEKADNVFDVLNTEKFSFNRYLELVKSKTKKNQFNLSTRRLNWRKVKISGSTSLATDIDLLNLNKSIQEAEKKLLEKKAAEDEAISRRLEEQRLEKIAEERLKALRPLTSEEKHIVKEALYGEGDSGDTVATSDTDYVVRRSMWTLRPGQWLNDEVIHYFLLMLANRDEKMSSNSGEKKRRSHFFKSFFVTKLLDDSGGYRYQNVKRWSKKVPGKDIFALDKIVCPVNMNGVHWTCAVIFIQDKRIQFFDSLGSQGRSYLQGLLQYLEDEHMDKKKVPLDTTDWELVPCDCSCPQQQNGFDCGVFTCMFADFVSRDLPLTFNQQDITACRERIALSIMNGSALF